MKIQYDFQKLKGKMVAYYGTQGNFAKELGMSKQSLSRKLHNEIRFTYEEIGTMLEKLHIRPEEVQEVFFSTKC